MKLAAALNRILHGAFKGRVDVIEQKLANVWPRKVLKGRQILWLLEEEFKLYESEGAGLEWEQILYVEMKNDNIEDFLNIWEATLAQLSLGTVPNAEVQLEALLQRQL